MLNESNIVMFAIISGVAAIVFYFANALPQEARIASLIVLTVIGTWAAAAFCSLQKIADHNAIVMDEIIGYGIAAFTAGQNIYTLGAAFIIFRVFDSIKIWPASSIDKRSKHQQGWEMGFGIMADDIIAGFQSLIVILLLQGYGLLA